MRRYREQCWECEFYGIYLKNPCLSSYYGYPFCAKSGQMSNVKTKKKCKDYLKKK